MHRIFLSLCPFFLATFLLGASAHAQTTSTVTGASSAHGRALGLGAVTMLNGTSGALVTWGNASGRFHIDGLVGLHRYRAANLNNTTDLSLGARAWYHVHASSFADFSVGGGIGFRSWTNDPGNPGSDSRVDVSIEAGGQIRAFIVSNVALLADLGFGATFGNSDDILFGSQAITRSAPPQGGSDFVVGTLGIAYFFE